MKQPPNFSFTLPFPSISSLPKYESPNSKTGINKEPQLDLLISAWM